MNSNFKTLEEAIESRLNLFSNTSGDLKAMYLPDSCQHCKISNMQEDSEYDMIFNMYVEVAEGDAIPSYLISKLIRILVGEDIYLNNLDTNKTYAHIDREYENSYGIATGEYTVYLKLKS